MDAYEKKLYMQAQKAYLKLKSSECFKVTSDRLFSRQLKALSF